MVSMEIYVEYAFIENFLLDVSLYYLALKFLKFPIKIKCVLLGGLLGAIFAVCYPILKLYAFCLAEILRVGMPFVICLCSFKRGDLKNDRGRYALSVLSFYVLSFAFAGGVYGVCAIFNLDYAYVNGTIVGVPLGVCFAVGVGLFAFIKRFFKEIYKRKSKTKFFYQCELTLNEKSIRANGFLDSGNLASKNGKPICFVTPDLFFDLVGLETSSLVMDELAVSTVLGNKKIKIFFLDEIKIYCDGGENIISKPYCAVKTLTGTREYKVLLGAWALEGQERKYGI